MRTRRWIRLVGLVLSLTACGNSGTTVGALNTVSVATTAVPTPEEVAPTVPAPTPSLVPTIVVQPTPTTAPTIAPTIAPTEAGADVIATVETEAVAEGPATRPELGGKIAFVRGSNLWL